MKPILLVTAMAAALAMSSTAQAALIDAFTVVQTVTDTTSNGAAQTSTNSSLGASSVFTSRTFSVNKTGTGANLAEYTDGNGLNISAAPSAKGVAYVEWTSGTGIDLTDGGINNLFRLNFTASDFASNLTITVTDSSNNTLSNSSAVSTPTLVADPTNFDVLFSSLTGTGLLTDVVKLRFSFSLPTNATDLSFDFFETNNNTVPEPAAISLMGVVMAGLALRNRKKA